MDHHHAISMMSPGPARHTGIGRWRGMGGGGGFRGGPSPSARRRCAARAAADIPAEVVAPAELDTGGGSNDQKSAGEPDPAGGSSTGRPGKPSREAIGGPGVG
jgi:hypothetical protein